MGEKSRLKFEAFGDSLVLKRWVPEPFSFKKWSREHSETAIKKGKGLNTNLRQENNTRLTHYIIFWWGRAMDESIPT